MSSIADARKIAATRAIAMAGKEFESPETLAKMTARATGTKVPLPERPIGQQVEQELAAAPPEPREGDSIMSQEGRLKEVGATGMVSAARRAAAQRAFLKDASPWGSAEMAYEGGKNVVAGVKEGSPKKVAIGAAQGAAGTGMLGLDMAGLGLLTTGTGPLLRSKLAEAVASLKPGQKIATQGLRAELTKRGVRKAEMNATQLDSLVKAAEERGQKSISKEEILEHIEETPVGITEIARGAKASTSEVEALAYEVKEAIPAAKEHLRERIMHGSALNGGVRQGYPGGSVGMGGDNAADWNQIMESPEILETLWPGGWEEFINRTGLPSKTRHGLTQQVVLTDLSAFGNAQSELHNLIYAVDQRFRFTPDTGSLQGNMREVVARMDKALEGLEASRKEARGLQILLESPDIDTRVKADAMGQYLFKHNTVSRASSDTPKSMADMVARVDATWGKGGSYVHSKATLKSDLVGLDRLLKPFTSPRRPIPGNLTWGQYKDKLLPWAAKLDEFRAAPAWQKYVDANKRLKEAKGALKEKPTYYEFIGAHAPGGENYGETTLHLETKALNDEPFRAGHFSGEGEENAVVHFRHTDRVDEQGRRILFVDEIQSDMHQQGRLRGYSPEENLALKNRWMDDVAELEDELLFGREKRLKLGPFKERRMLAQEWMLIDSTLPSFEDLEILRKKLKKAEDRLSLSNMGHVPEGIFKGTKEWTGLALKRIMRKAAEEGYQGVAFTRGKDAMKYSHMKPEGAYYYDTIVPSVAAKIAAPKGVSKAKIDKTTINIPTFDDITQAFIGTPIPEEFPVVWLTDAVKGRAMLPYDKFAAVLAAGAAGAAGAKTLQDRKGEEEQ